MLKEKLGEELYAQVMEKLGDEKIDIVSNGEWIPKAKFDEVNEQKKEYKRMADELDAKIADVTKQSKDHDGLKEELNKLRSENEQVKTEYEERLQKQSFDFTLEQAIRDAKARNPKAVKALLDTEAIKLEGDKLTGFEDQLKTVKESDSYLFGEEKPSKGGGEFGGGGEPTENPWSKEHFNLTKQAEILRKNPDLAAHLKSKTK